MTEPLSDDKIQEKVLMDINDMKVSKCSMENPTQPH